MTDKRKKIDDQKLAADRYARTLNGDDDIDSVPTPKVGYGSPPLGTRFRRGMSGNPKGRPKGRKNLKTAITDLLTERMTVRVGNKTKKVSSLEAIFMTTRNNALKGDQRAIQFLHTTAKALGLMDHVPQKVVVSEDLSHMTTDELIELERLLIKAGGRILPK